MENEILEQLKRIADALEKMVPLGLGGGTPIVRHIHEHSPATPFGQHPFVPSYTTGSTK